MKFAMITQVGSSMFLVVSHTPYHKRGRPTASQKFRDPLHVCTQCEKTTTKFCMVIKLNVRKFFYPVFHECGCAICLSWLTFSLTVA